MSARPPRSSGPVVGILLGRSPAERYSLHRGYVDSVVAVGGSPLLLAMGPVSDGDRLSAQLECCDAILVSGGADVDPELSRLERPEEAFEYDRRRDDAEIAMICLAHKTGRPVLGICRGIQILAVAFGGSLIGDLDAAGCPGHAEEARQYETVHRVSADPGTLASRVLADCVAVNSAHHQAVREPGVEQHATAWSPDGVIEAIEGPGMLGIQWHPERLSAGDPRHLAAFSWLVG